MCSTIATPTMTTTSRRQRGWKTQRIIAEYLQTHGFPTAKAGKPFQAGADVLGVAGVDIEVKAQKDIDRLAALRQSHARPGDVHLIFERPNGYGEQTLDRWPVTVTIAEIVRLLRLAGYGDPIEGA